MNYFECCHYCPDTKRHPGCHSTCKDYIEQKKLWEGHKESERQKALAPPPAKTDWLNKPVWNSRKR